MSPSSTPSSHASAPPPESTETASSGRRSGAVLVASLMLFSMFFGAGNLIFPPMLGAQAGSSTTPALLGFLSTGVLLPVLAILAIAVTGRDLQDLANRGGRVFGVVFTVLVYLSIGAFYALPRTGSVSYETAVAPYLGEESLWIAAAFSAAFFGISLLLAFDPSGIVDRLGRFLTPALLILLVVLITMAVLRLSAPGHGPTEEYASAPYVTGFLEGYNTMDSLAGLAFGIIVVASLRAKGVSDGPAIVRGVSLAGVIAGVLLAAVYIGLAIVGLRMPEGQSHPDGASLLAEAAVQVLGGPGAVVFGLIVVLACLTTSVGLIGATSEFFHKLVPALSYRVWAILFTVIAFLVSTAGLETVLAIAGPIVGFLYPAGITLILLTLIEPLTRRRLNLTFRLALAVAIVWAALMTLSDLGVGVDPIKTLIGWTPLHAQGMGWVVPTVVAAVVGFAVDLARGASDPVPVGGESQEAAQERVDAAS